MRCRDRAERHAMLGYLEVAIDEPQMVLMAWYTLGGQFGEQLDLSHALAFANGAKTEFDARAEAMRGRLHRRARRNGRPR